MEWCGGGWEDWGRSGGGWKIMVDEVVDEERG